MPNVIAVIDMQYDGKPKAKGERFTITDKEATVLLALQRVALDKPEGAPALSKRTGKPKRRYQRRDLKAEE